MADWQTLIELTIDDARYWAEDEWKDTKHIKSQTLTLMAQTCGISYERLNEIHDGAEVLPEEEFYLAVAACAHTPIIVCDYCGVPEHYTNWKSSTVYGEIGTALESSLRGIIDGR